MVWFNVNKTLLVGDLISEFLLVELTVCTTQLVQISPAFFPGPKNRIKWGPSVSVLIYHSLRNLITHKLPKQIGLGRIMEFPYQNTKAVLLKWFLVGRFMVFRQGAKNCHIDCLAIQRKFKRKPGDEGTYHKIVSIEDRAKKSV